MKRLIPFVLLALIPITVGRAAQAADGPDFKLRCKNGKYAKVWLAPLKIENHCGLRSKQWVEFYWNDTDEDVYARMIHPATKQKTGWYVKANDVRVRLGRGIFCPNFEEYREDLTILVVYSPDSSWRPAPCEREEVIGKRL